MEEFDYKKFLIENKLTINSRLLKEEKFKRVSASELYPHDSDMVDINFPIIIKSKQDWSDVVGDLVSVGFKWNDGNELTSEDAVDKNEFNKYPYQINIADKNKKLIAYSPISRKQMG
jgi:hypothetical protein